MNKKITLFALAANCGFLGASGFWNGVDPSAATACLLRKPSLERRPVNASEVNAPPVCQKNSRRVRWQKLLVGWWVMGGLGGRCRMALLGRPVINGWLCFVLKTRNERWKPCFGYKTQPPKHRY